MTNAVPFERLDQLREEQRPNPPYVPSPPPPELPEIMEEDTKPETGRGIVVVDFEL